MNDRWPFLHKLLPDTPILVVFIPSPLSSYRLHGPDVSIFPFEQGRATRYGKELVREYSNRICLLIRAASVGQGAGFLDLRALVRAAAAHVLVHGPRDFHHFNRLGMEILGRAVAERIDRPSAQEPCSQIAD